MRKPHHFFFLIVFLFLSLFSLHAVEDNSLEVNTARMLSGIQDKAVFIGTAGGELFFGIEEQTSPDSSKYASHLYTVQNSASGYQIVKKDQLNTPVRECGFVDHGETFFIIGGYTSNGPSDQVYQVDGKNGQLNALAPLPVGLADPAVGVIGQQLIVTAGKAAHGNNNQTWALDYKDKKATWRNLSPIPFDNGPLQHSVVQNAGDEDYLYLFGEKILTYSMKRDEWADLTLKSKQPIDVRGQLPITMGTHHILFLDPNGKYCTYHTVTGQWDNRGFVADPTENTFVCK
ncbi:MAG: hypothetical protein ACRC9Q_08160, partial [Bacteroidales bacterium]